MNEAMKNKIIVMVDSDLKDLIPNFLENRRADVKSLEDALRHKDFEKLKQVAHILKGVGGGYGFDLITELGTLMESFAKEMNLTGIREALTQLNQYLEQVEVTYE